MNHVNEVATSQFILTRVTRGGARSNGRMIENESLLTLSAPGERFLAMSKTPACAGPAEGKRGRETGECDIHENPEGTVTSMVSRFARVFRDRGSTALRSFIRLGLVLFFQTVCA